MLPCYAELHCLSNFTFLRAASHPHELVARAAQLDYRALALTDECSLAGVVRAHLAAKDCKFKLIIGSEIRLRDGPKLVLLACDREGYGNLSELITRGRRAASKGSYALTRADLARGLAGCLALWVPDAHPSEDDARWVRERFPGSSWLAVELLRGVDDQTQLATLLRIGRSVGLPLVAAGDVHMHVRARKKMADVLTAIRLGMTVNEAGGALHPNSERHLRPIGRLAQLYPPELLAETLNVAERCTFSLEELRYEYPEELVPAGQTPTSHLRELTDEGLSRRYPHGIPQKTRTTVEHELRLIAELRYEPFFLTVYDVVRYAKEQGILCQGRGSAANSAVCFALGITEVDPEHMEVLFERFISRERNEPPDIDVDFEHQRREEVLQYVYRKYGRERAALAATLIAYRPKSALRDVGKAMGLSLDQVDRLAKSITWWDDRHDLPRRLREIGFDPDNPRIQQVIALANELYGFPRHLSQHVGGVVIARDKLSRLAPIENAAMPERTVVEWDKDDLDALGLLKVDILALGMLSAIRRALGYINAMRAPAEPLTLATIPPKDSATFDMICRADTVGVFQIESRAQMSMLPRLKPRSYYDLVIEVAIVRPGPIQGGMVHPYLRRRQGKEAVTYHNDEIKKVLERTLGVSIFQEQVMQLAVVAAGFTAGEADQLRRAMASWRRKGGLEPFHEKLIAGMRARGIAVEFAEQIYKQIQGFGEYGFPESHAASFALLVYVSSWIKCHEPAAFACALLNSQPMGFYASAQLVQDARRHRVEVRAVDVTVSTWDCTLERNDGPQPALRLGLRLVRGLAQAAGERIAAARREAAYVSVGDLARRALLKRHDLDCLAAADALASLAGHRRNALWHTMGVETPTAPLAPAPIAERQPQLLPPSEGENIIADYAHLGFTLRRHPLALLRAHLRARKLITAEELRAAPSGRHVRAAGIVTCRQRPGTAKDAIFVTLEDETGSINVIVWRDLAQRQRRELLGARLLGVAGQVEKKGDVVHLIAGRLFDHSGLLGRLQVGSRDFH